MTVLAIGDTELRRPEGLRDLDQRLTCAPAGPLLGLECRRMFRRLNGVVGLRRSSAWIFRERAWKHPYLVMAGL